MLHDYNSDDTRLGSGLGRVMDITDESIDNPDYTPYVEIKESAAGTSVIQTMSAATSPNMLPALNYATGVANCVDCNTAPTSSATAAATAAAVVTPMAEAPSTINWLLIVMGLGLTYALVKDKPKSGLGNAPEPAPVPTVQQDLGRPPRKNPSLKHVESLGI